MLDIEEYDRSTFDDSERFEESDDCSYISEPESLCNNWRGWKKPFPPVPNNNNSSLPNTSGLKNEPIKSLAELCARTVAAHIPFEIVEQMMPVVPEQIQLWIAFWSFPDCEEDIRLYSCLANGNADEFIRGETLYRHNCVQEVLQIGFHLSATINISGDSKSASKEGYKVAVSFDRGRIATCNCTCTSNASWCSHVVAVCLHRIHQQNNVKLRAPVSESLSRLQRDQLQKFAQYLISELPQQILPTAQRLIDEILSSQLSDINTVSGAPDPTAGGSASEQTNWWLDEKNLQENIQKILIKLCVPSPALVYSDVNFLSQTAPPVATEWLSLLRPLRGREPEGMWNLLSIVREMFKRQDHNAIPLLEVITVECLKAEKILVWWVDTRVALQSGSSGQNGKNSVHSGHGHHYTCSSLCDEIVVLWRLAALNPALSPNERELLKNQFKNWHVNVLEKISKDSNKSTNREIKRKGSDIDIFPGFKPAFEACLLDWDDYPLNGITYSPAASRYYCPVMCCKHDLNHDLCTAPISAPTARMPPQFSGVQRTSDRRMLGLKRVGASLAYSGGHWSGLKVNKEPNLPNRSERSSSVSSEGFCDNELGRDSDSTDERTPDQKSSNSDSRRGSHSSRELKTKSVVKNIFPGAQSSSGTPSQVLDDDVDQGFGVEETDNEGGLPAAPNKDAELDGYGVYVYNPNLVQELLVRNNTSRNNTKKNEKFENMFKNVKKLDDPLEILFARAEGLHAHGHTSEACNLAVHLATELLANPPVFMFDLTQPLTKSKRKKLNPISHQLTCLASATLNKCAFLCTVLSEDRENTHLAFKVALFGLEMQRAPGSTKPLEVKLDKQESDLVSLLKKLPLGPKELTVIREKAEIISKAQHNVRGDALLPLTLTGFIFDALVISASTRIAHGLQHYRHVRDESLGFEAAVAALGMKASVSEADHPLLCEGTRRQRGELALTLLTHYKDNREKLAIIMEKMLDKNVHQMFKSHSTHNLNTSTKNNSLCITNENQEPSRRILSSPIYSIAPHPHSHSVASNWSKGNEMMENVEESVSNLSLSSNASGARPKLMNRNLNEITPNTVGGEIELSPSRKLSGTLSYDEDSNWEQNMKNWAENVNKQRSKKMIRDFSAPSSSSNGGPDCEASSSGANNRRWMKRKGPGSDSGSSGNSSDSVVSYSSGDKLLFNENKFVESPPLSSLPARTTKQGLKSHSNPRPHPHPGKMYRYKGKRAYPTIPNQPSDAGAYYMFELAKTLLTKAGGTSGTSLFKSTTDQQNHRGPHRALQMCAFQIGLYALGLYNCVSPNWLSRTYSSHVSWISNQAIEIGATALSFLIDTWEGHLTPQEAASIADKASKGRDANTIREAARLALSCLPHAHALNPIEIKQAIDQCKELSNSMLESACLAVESAAKGGGVYPEVLFSVAKHWDELFVTRNTVQTRQSNRRGNQNGGQLQRQDAPVTSSLANPRQAGCIESPPQVASTLHGSSGLASTFSVGSGASPLNYGIPTAIHYPIPYNYIPTLPPTGIPTGISCINQQIPVQMYLHTAGVQFNGNQPHSQLIPPPPVQFYPQVSIPSSQNNCGTPPVSQVGNVALQSPAMGPGPQIPISTSPAQLGLSHPAQAAFYSLPYSGPITSGGFVPLNTSNLSPAAIIPFLRSPSSQLIQHRPHLPPHSQPSIRGPQMVPNEHHLVSNNADSFHYLISAYRVGMLAMETLARRVQDDRPQARYARHPPYGEDVKWLLGVAKKLGNNYLHQFCLCAVNSVVSPFILYDLAADVASYYQRGSPNATMYHQHLRSPILQPLIQKCQQMFIQCTHMKMYYITPSDYDEFLSIIRTARLAFQMTATGMIQFNDLLQTLRKSKCCKKELWQRINAALQQPPSTV